MKSSKNMLAIAYGTDGVCGDSAFVPTDEEQCPGFPIKATVTMGLFQLRRLYHEHCQAVCGQAGTPLPGKPVGFWLLTEDEFAIAMRTKRLVEEITSTEYVVNGLVKKLLASVATVTIGDKSVLSIER